MILCSLNPDYDIRKAGENEEFCTSSYLSSFLALSPTQNQGLTFMAPSHLSPLLTLSFLPKETQVKNTGNLVRWESQVRDASHADNQIFFIFLLWNHKCVMCKVDGCLEVLGIFPLERQSLENTNIPRRAIILS